MIKEIATVAIYVSDQKAAEEFWVNKVGFEVRAKHEMGHGTFWLEVAPPKNQSRLVLFPKNLMHNWAEKKPSIVFFCDDIDKTYLYLKSRGVDVGPEPQKMSWGNYATFKDPDGNEFLLKS